MAGKATPASVAAETERKTRWGVAASVGFSAGAAIGWWLWEDVLRALVAPWHWESRGIIYDGNPSEARLLWWHTEIAAVAGLLVALPLLALAGRSWLARRFAWPRAVHPARFLLSSYLAIAASSWGWALVARPRFVAEERARWGTLAPLPWAYVSHELGQLLQFALAGQACVILVMLAKARKAARLSA